MSGSDLTGARLSELCEQWQARLRLRDWVITLGFVKTDGKNYGSVEVTYGKKRAHMVLHGDCTEQLERVIVHELIHLHLYPFQGERGTLEHDLVEQAVTAIADGIIIAKEEKA